MTVPLPERLRALGRRLGRADRRLLYDAAQRIQTLEYQAFPALALPPLPSRWGCTTLAGCERGWNGTEEAMPRDWIYCPSCGGRLAEIQEGSVLSGGSGVCRPIGGPIVWVNTVTGPELPEQIRRVRDRAQRARAEGWREADDVLALVSLAEGARVLYRLEVAARELDALLSGTATTPVRWLDGLVVTEPAAHALLALRGYLADLDYLRSQEPGTVEPEPAHLRDDAPVLICGRCRRETVDAEVGGPCAFPQPDGSKCPGVFEQPELRQVPEGDAYEALRDALVLLEALRIHFTEYDRERTDGLTSPIIARIDATITKALRALEAAWPRGVDDDLRFAIGVLEAAAPPREQDEGHYANRALVYLYAIREALGMEPS